MCEKEIEIEIDEESYNCDREIDLCLTCEEYPCECEEEEIELEI